MLDPIGLLESALLAPVTRLFDVQQQTFWLSYLGCLAMALGFFLWSRRKHRATGKGLARYLWPARLLAHPSTLLDLKIYVLGSMYLSLQGATIFASMESLEPFL